MNSKNKERKERLVRIWDKMACFAKWCADHGIPKMLVKIGLKLFLWWFKQQFKHPF